MTTIHPERSSCRLSLWLLAGALMLPTPMLLSQTRVGAHVIALDRGTAPQPPRLHAIYGCTWRRVCDLGPPMSVHGAAVPEGGTTFDSTHGKEWSSDGRDIVLTSRDCKQTCSYHVDDTLPVVTGLAVNRARGWLYTSHLDNRIRIWADSPDCKLKLLGECPVRNLASGEIVTGIEFDSRIDKEWPKGRLFCVTTRGYLIVLAEPGGAVCDEICRVTLPSCSPRFTTYTGLTYDPGKREIWITDGKRVMRLYEARSCQLELLECCEVCPVDKGCYALSGLGWYQGEIGLDPGSKPCTDAVCGCVPQIDSVGFPSVLNRGFAVTLAGLQPKGVSVVALTLGPATKGVPFGCGALYVNPSPLLLTFPAVHQPATGCGSTASVPLGFLPPAAGGLTLTVQALTVCPASKGVGVALSAAMTMEVGW